MKKEREEKKRLDMKVDLYKNILKYSEQNSLGGSTLGSKVLVAVEYMYNNAVKKEDHPVQNSVDISEENKKVLSSFQNFDLLEGSSLSQAVNEALGIYIQEHKAKLQKKIEEL